MHKNSIAARRIAIEMLCRKGSATCDEVNAAIGGDGSHIKESSCNFIKSHCHRFNKYPSLKDAHCNKPFNGSALKKAYEHLEAGGTL